MKKIIPIIILIALLSGCATARVVGTIRDDIKQDNEVSSVSDSDVEEMMWEWAETALQMILFPVK